MICIDIFIRFVDCYLWLSYIENVGKNLYLCICTPWSILDRFVSTEFSRFLDLPSLFSFGVAPLVWTCFLHPHPWLYGSLWGWTYSSAGWDWFWNCFWTWCMVPIWYWVRWPFLSSVTQKSRPTVLIFARENMDQKTILWTTWPAVRIHLRVNDVDDVQR